MLRLGGEGMEVSAQAIRKSLEYFNWWGWAVKRRPDLEAQFRAFYEDEKAAIEALDAEFSPREKEFLAARDAATDDDTWNLMNEGLGSLSSEWSNRLHFLAGEFEDRFVKLVLLAKDG